MRGEQWRTKGFMWVIISEPSVKMGAKVPSFRRDIGLKESVHEKVCDCELILVDFDSIV